MEGRAVAIADVEHAIGALVGMGWPLNRGPSRLAGPARPSARSRFRSPAPGPSERPEFPRRVGGGPSSAAFSFSSASRRCRTISCLSAFAGVTPASIAPGATAPTEVRQPSSETFVPPETEKMPAPPRRRVCVTGGQEDTGPVWISRPFGRQIPRRCGFWNTRFLQDAANTPLKSRQEDEPKEISFQDSRSRGALFFAQTGIRPGSSPGSSV